MRSTLKHVPKSTRTEKAAFIMQHFPEVLGINPRTEYKLITKIRNAMYEHGLYARTYDSASGNADSAIIRIIDALKAQHKK